MALPSTLSPTTPADTATVASVPGFIRAVKQYLADAFGFPTTLNAAPFTITAGGVVTLQQSGALVVADPTVALGIASKQYVDSKAGGAGGGYASANLGAPVSLSASTGTILTLALTAPSGGPFRLFVSYSLALSNPQSSVATADFQVSDGSHIWAGVEQTVGGTLLDGIQASDISPTTYLAGAVVNLTLQAKLIAGASLTATVTNGGLLTSFLRGMFIPSA